MANSIDKTSEVNKIANSLTDTDFFSGSGRKQSKEVENLQNGIKAFGSGIGSLIPGASFFCGIASAVLGGIAAALGS